MFKITYSNNLKWEVLISWSKNAALPIVAANFLSDNSVKLDNVPDIKDVNLLYKIGKESLKKSKDFFDLTSDDAIKIRASILLIPVWLVKFGKVVFCGSGGCKIGKRPLDAFDDALIQAGVNVTQDKYKTYEVQRKPQKRIVLQELSVTTTEALITYLAFLQNVDYDISVHQIAIEPHVINLIEFLQTMWANIKLNYDHSLVIRPTKINIKNSNFKIICDYIQAGTYFGIWAVADESEIFVKWVEHKDLLAVYKTAERIGIDFELIDNDIVRVNSKHKKAYKAVKFDTRTFPWFPTDLQSIFGALLTQANWVSKIFETIFEWRFAYLNELTNLGAEVEILNPHQAIIIWPSKLKWWYVSTTDLRGGGAMVLAGTIAKGTTYITNEDIILRWYDNIIDNLKNIWVNIEHII